MKLRNLRPRWLRRLIMIPVAALAIVVFAVLALMLVIDDVVRVAGRAIVDDSRDIWRDLVDIGRSFVRAWRAL